MTSARFVVVVVVTGCLAAPAFAQGPAAPPSSSVRPAEAAQKARYQLRVMEGVLENAVQHGVRSVSQQMRVIMPDQIFFGAAPRARGFRLDGFGVFFDVEVPTLRPSMVWTMRTLTQGAPDMARYTSTLKKLADQQNDQSTKRELERMMKIFEAQSGPLGGTGVAAAIAEGDAVGAAGRPGKPVANAAPVETPVLNPYTDLPDPAEAYETEVKRALADAMLEYGTTLNIADNDVLSIAARSNEELGGSNYDVITVMMTLKGSDLNALKTGAATADEIRRRIVVQEY